MDKDLICCITDGMDKSKYALPRWSMGRAPKDSVIDRVQRPELSVSAAIVHGLGTYVFIAGEGTSTGSSFKMDIVLQALNAAWKHASRTNRAWPQDLSLPADIGS